ncbi:MAG: two-component system OmpR family alkaline phosphatase synthesis response regulator PhoP [Nitrospirae bacterium]|nr:MAG: two-component system OmpR family alkaline phosphatase synthesis response regulator PhoP [Nitrospirota bacterium]
MKNAHILLVDDDADILKVLKANLELHSFTVLTAETWEGGQKQLQISPDLVVLDAMLPDGDGFTICRQIREQHPSLPIIMLTARDKISDKVIGLESGADDYIVKPFETLELIARIKVCLRRLQPTPAQSVHVGDIAVDFERRQVLVKDKGVVVTSKEFDLLSLLIMRRGKVVSRDEIRKHLWKESDIYSWSRVIDVHIQHLRQKIESESSSPEYILTVPGVGYRFRD